MKVLLTKQLLHRTIKYKKTSKSHHLQPQLLKRPDGVQWRVRILLLNFHLIRVLNEITTNKFV